MAEVNAVEKQPVTQEYLKKMDAYWRAANYLGAAQLYLLDNPLLREPLTMDHIKKKIVGHWGTVPGQNFVYVHLNRGKYIFRGNLQRGISEHRRGYGRTEKTV